MSNCDDALAWRSIFEIVKSPSKCLPAPGAAPGRRYQRRFTVYGARRRPGEGADERTLPDEARRRCLRMLCGEVYGADRAGVASRRRRPRRASVTDLNTL